MNMPKDTKGTGPEDVEAHARYGSDESQGVEQRDSGEDVEAHRRHFFDTDQTGTDEDVEAHLTRQKRDAQGEEPGHRYDTSEDVEDVKGHVGRVKVDTQDDDEMPRLR